MLKEIYTWTQEFTEVELTFKLNRKVDKNFVKLFQTSEKIKLTYDSEIMVEGEVFEPIKPDETYWYIIDDEIKLVLSKKKGSWWKCVIKGHKEIDASKVAESKTISDLNSLDPEERRIVQEMMFNQKNNSQKMGIDGAGEDKQEILRKLAQKNPDLFLKKNENK